MTGRNPNRLGIRDWIPPQRGIFMRPSEITVAQLLKKAGERKLHAGKWHLNSRTDGSVAAHPRRGWFRSLAPYVK
jgi:arylsulfatase A